MAKYLVSSEVLEEVDEGDIKFLVEFLEFIKVIPTYRNNYRFQTTTVGLLYECVKVINI